MYCPHCGKENRNESRFCTSCGKQLAHPLTTEQHNTIGTAKEKKFNFTKTWLYITIFTAILLIIVFGNSDVELLENILASVLLAALIGVIITYVVKWSKKVQNPTHLEVNTKYKGVGGWMYIPLFNFFILFPITAIIEIFTTAAWAAVIDLALAGYMISAGYLLVKYKPGAVKHSKFVLGAVIALGFVGIIIFASLDITEADKIDGYTSYARSMIWSLVWIWYFSVSKRVKATYTS